MTVSLVGTSSPFCLCCATVWGGWEKAGLPIPQGHFLVGVFALKWDVRCVSLGADAAAPTNHRAPVWAGDVRWYHRHTGCPCGSVRCSHSGKQGPCIPLCYSSTWLSDPPTLNPISVFCIDPDRTAWVRCVQSEEKYWFCSTWVEFLTEKQTYCWCFGFYFSFGLYVGGFCTHHTVFDPCEV